MAYFNNKNAHIRKVMKNTQTQIQTKIRDEKLVLGAYRSNMMVSLLTLFEDLNFREKRIQTFIKGYKTRYLQHENNELTYEDMRNKLQEYGIMLEGIHYIVKDGEIEFLD